MSIIIPPFVTPVLWFYSLQHHWPGIDEDAVVEWGEHAVAWIEATDTFANELVNLLGEVGENTETEVFVAIRDTFEVKKTEDFDPWLGIVKDAIPWVCQGMRAAITVHKGGVLTILSINVAGDIPLIMSGVGLVAVLAKKALVAQLLNVLLQEAKEKAVEELTKVALGYVETEWLNDEKDRLKEAIVEKLTSLAATQVTDSGTSANTQLLATSADVLSCIVRLSEAVEKFQKATEDDGPEEEPELEDDSVPGADKLIAACSAEVLKWGSKQLKSFAVDLSLALLDSLTEMLMHADETLTEAEQQCHDAAADLRITLAELRPVGRANASSGAPDFYAPVREMYGLGAAEANAANPGSLDAPVADQRGLGTARANPQDVSVLDASTDTLRGTGRAGGSDDQSDVDSTVDVTEGVDVPSSDTGDDVTELDAGVTPV